MKKTPSLNKFNHGIAAYPEGFKGCMVTEGKICLQFLKTQLKTRVVQEHIQQLKKGPQHSREIPVNTNGTDIDILAVGVPIELHKVFQMDLVEAYKKYIEEFDPSFKEFIKIYITKLQDIL